jgi:hypothetical protein
VKAHRGLHLIDHPARRGVQLLGGNHVLVTSIMVTPMAYRTNPRRLAMIRLAVSEFRRGVRRGMRSSTDSNRALNDMHDRECEKAPQEQANTKRLPTDDPPLTPHGTTL